MPVIQFHHEAEELEVEATAVTCPSCQGEGFQISELHHPNGYIQREANECPACEGTGLILAPIPSDPNFEAYMKAERHAIEMGMADQAEATALNRCF